MTPDDLYRNYLQLREQGLKDQAGLAVQAMVRSLTGDKERRHWVWRHLEDIYRDHDGRLRHVIFRSIVYPVLREGFDAGDVKSIMWLARLSQNIYQDNSLQHEVESLNAGALYRKCHELEPDNMEVRRALLQHLLTILQHAVHEWPAGILCGMDAASTSDCAALFKELALARKLDVEHRHREFLGAVEEMFHHYMERLGGHDWRCRRNVRARG